MGKQKIFFFFLFLSVFSAFAQKNKKQELIIITGKELTPEDSNKVTQLFYSGLREKVVQNQTLAIDYFNQILQIYPANHFALYELGMIYFKKGDLTQAKDYAQKAVTIKTDNEWYWLLNANIYQQLQDFSLLNYALDELINLAPLKTEYRFDKANALFMMGRADEALTLYNKLEKEVGLTDQVLQGRQRIYLKKGDISKASADLGQLIKNNPTDVRYYLFLGDLYYSNHMADQALTVYQKAKEIDGNNPFTRIAIAQILESQKKTDEAFEEIKAAFKQESLGIDQKVKIIIKYFDSFPDTLALKKAQELSLILTQVHPSDPKSFSLYGDVLYQKGDYKLAQMQYEKALDLNKNIYAIWDQLLRIQLYFNDGKGLVAKGEEALSYFPNQYQLYFYTAFGYLQENNASQAINYFNNALNFDIDNAGIKAQIYSGLGDAYQSEKKYKESANAYEKALAIEPKNTYALNNYAYYLSLRNDDLAKAERMSALSNKLAPGNASFQDTYAWILFKLEKYADAKEWMLKAIENNPKSALQFEHLGDIYYKLNDVNNALINWKKSLLLNSKNSLLQKKIDGKKYIE
ncbi:tetratricopeptide repeat protein [Pedobacter sp. SD-b]|uniref:Tetratricopeptide repeat protein n=1 Tax=Pedobacter segetis TaxID=2793069 RepID=A0ABS1BIP1_9SPHI|nr:tetratricopeptide repeat protein [Pedobacter segetis]MBK0382712.1 tetratricopeptide repeat protein [Pedobacter segetis]